MLKRILVFTLAVCLMIMPFNGVSESFADEEEKFGDIEGHWAEASINRHIKKGRVSGYTDGSFKPDNEVTLAETITIFNKCLGLNKSEAISEDSDVWYGNELAKAEYYGYIETLETQPNDKAKRIEILTMMNLLLDCEEERIKQDQQNFSDIDGLDGDEQNMVSEFSQLGYIDGYGDNTFRPDGTITRAELLAIIDNVTGYIVESQEDLDNIPNDTDKITIIGHDLVVKDLDTKADIYISSGAEGNIKIKDCKIEGQILISGGNKEQTIEVENTDVQKVVVTKSKEIPQVEFIGTNNIEEVKTKTESNIVVTGETYIEDITTEAATGLVLNKGSQVVTLTIQSETIVESNEGSEIENLEAQEKVQISGEGHIKSAIIESNDVEIENRPEHVQVDDKVGAAIISDSKMDKENDDVKEAERDDSSKNSGSSSKDKEERDRTPPSGYTVTIDQTEINSANKELLSFSIANAEVRANYHYSINDTDDQTLAVSGDGKITTKTQQVTNIDVSQLSEGTLTLTLSLKDNSNNQGNSVNDSVEKDTLAPENYNINIDQEKINSLNETEMSFIFEGAEIGASYMYSIDDTNSETDPVTGIGTIATETDQITSIDVSTLKDDTLTLTVYLTDTFGNQGAQVTDTVVKKATLVSGYSVSIDQGQIEKGNESALSFTISNAEIGAEYTYILDDMSGDTDPIEGSGTISTSDEMVSNLDVSGLKDGTLILRLYLTDTSLNQGVDVTDTVIKDTQAPEGYVANFDQDFISSVNQNVLSFTFTSAEVGASFNYSIDDDDNVTPAITGNGTITTASHQVSNINVSDLEDSTITLSVSLTDSFSNQGSTVTDDLDKDTIAPSGFLVTLDQSEITSLNQTELSFTFADAELGASFEYRIDDESVITTPVTGNGAILTETDQVTEVDVNALEDGTLTLTVSMTDEVGNQSTNVTDTIQKDATGPTGFGVTIDQSGVNNANKRELSFTMNGAEVGASYKYSIDDNNNSTRPVVGSGTVSTATHQISNINVSGLDDDTLTISLILTDTLLNESEAATNTVLKDIITPSGYSISFDQNLISLQTQENISFSFTGAEVDAHYNYSIDDANGVTDEITGKGTISSSTNQITGIDCSNLDDGTLTLTAYLTDPNGNQGSNATDTESKDATAPSGYSVSIDQTGIDSSNQSTLSFTFSNAERGASYSYSIDDTDNEIDPITGEGTITATSQKISNIDVSDLTDGTLTLTVYLTDVPLNQGANVTDTVIKDLTAPSGYSVTIDQEYINNGNKTALSFTFANAEVDANYNYSIDDSNDVTDTVTGSGTITSASEQVSAVDVSSLDDGTLILTVYLTDTFDNQGSNVFSSVTKDIVAPSGYSVSIDQSKIINSNKTGLSFTFASTEVGANYNYSIDDANGLTDAVTGKGTISTATDQISMIDVSGLDDGTLTITAYLTDTAKNQGSNTTATVAKDATAPLGYGVNIDQSYINNSNKAALSFTFSGAEIDATYNYSIDDTNGTTDAVNSNGTISTATDQINTIDVSGLDDETLTLTVYLTDTSTNQGNNITDTVVKDIVAPTGYTVNIDQGMILANSKTALSFTFAGAEVGAEYNYSIDDANGTTDAVTGSGTITTSTDQVSNIDVSGLDDGTLSLTVYLTDPAGNQGSNNTDTVAKDATIPTGYGVSIDQSNINNSNNTALSFTFSGAETEATYNYSIDDANGATDAVIGNGTISTATDQISTIDVSSLDDGTLTLTVYLTDTNTNQGGNATDTIVKDLIAPTGYSVNIDQSNINNGNKAALSFTFAGAEVGATYNYSIDDTNGTTDAVSSSGTISTATDTISSIDVTSLDDETLTLTVYLTDTYTNQGTNVTDTVVKDVVAPSGYSVSIDQSKIINSNKSTLSFTFASAEVGTIYNYSIDDANGDTSAVSGNGTISTAADQISNINVSGLDDGTLTLTVYLTDTAGNQGSNATNTVAKDATAPMGYGVSIDQSGINNSNKAALSFTFLGAEVDASYNYSIDDTNGSTTAVSSSGTISTATDTISSIDVTSLDDDTLTLTVYLTDTSTNQGTNVTGTITKDIVAPSGYSVSIDQGFINSGNKTALSFTFASAEVGATYSYSIDDTNGGTSAVTGSSTVSSATEQISNINVNGLDDDMLTLTVYLTDPVGNQGSNTTDTVTKEATAPSGYSVSIDQGSYINNSNKAAMSFTFASAEIGATYNYSIDDTNGGTTAITGNGTISTTTDTISSIDVTSLDDDTLTLTVYLTDTNANQGANTTDTVTKDIVAPSGYSVNVDQAYVNYSNKAAVSFTFASAETGTTYNYSLDDTNGGTSAVTGSSTVSSATEQITSINATSLDDDTLTLTVYLTDPAGNQGGNVTDTVTKEVVVPSGYSVSIDQGNYINNSNKAAVSFTFASAEVGTTYSYSIDDTNGGTSAVTGSATVSSATQQITSINTTGLDDDTLTLTVYLTDTAGNQGANATDNATKDVVAPSGYSVSIDQGSYINNSNKAAVSFTFASAETSTIYNYSLDDTNGGTSAVTGSASVSSATQQITSINGTSFDDDTLTLTVYLTDAAGNQGGNVTDIAAKDVVAPSGYSISIDQGSITSANQTVLSYTFTSAEVGAIYSYSVDDTNGGTSAVTGSTSVGSASEQITGINVTGLDDDTLTVTVYLTDAAGNQGSNTTDTVVKDATSPGNVTGYPKADTPSKTGFTVRGKLQETGTVYYVVLLDNATEPSATEVKNGTANGGGVVEASGSFTVNAETEGTDVVTGLSPGTDYDVYVVSEDSSENMQSSAEIINVTTSFDTPTSIEVSASGSVWDADDYFENGMYDMNEPDFNSTGRPRYKNRIDDGFGDIFIYWDSGVWIIKDSEGPLHIITSNDPIPPKTGWDAQDPDINETVAVLLY